MRGLECTTDDNCWMVGRYAIYRTTNGGELDAAAERICRLDLLGG